MTARTFRFTGGTNKFWTVTLAPGASEYEVHFGAIGTKGQRKVKMFTSAVKAQAAANSQINEKLGKGYVEDGAAAPADVVVPAVRPTAAPRRPAVLAMLAQDVPFAQVADLAADDRYVFEPKMDGDRVLIEWDGTKATAVGRHGRVSKHNPLFQRPPHGADVNRLGDRRLVLDGELIGSVLWVFDLPAYDGGGTTFDVNDSWTHRHAALEALFAAWQPDPACFRLVPVARSTEAKLQLVIDQRDNLGEGVIIKRAASTYRPGVRCSDCQKAKFAHTADLIVMAVGVNGKDNAHLGALDDNGQLVEVGRCSTIGKGAVAVGDLIEVKYLYFMNRLVQPRMMRQRDDTNVDTVASLHTTDKDVMSR